MIFKQLFQPKWKHPKETTRLGALAQLDKQQDAHILTTLACEDPSVNVRTAALKKLNDVALWWQACQQDGEPSIKRLANQKVAEAILASPNALSDADKERYIERFAADKTLEQLALQEKTAAIKIKLLTRLNKAPLVEQVFRGADEALQLQLCELVLKLQLTEKLLKVAKGEAKQKLQEVIDEQQRQAQMPVEVAEQAKLILAKLNALRDKTDYQLVSGQFSQLQKQYQQLELEWLDEELRGQTQQKFTQLAAKLTTHSDKLKVAFEQQQEQQLAKQRSVLALANLSALAEEISNAMALRFDGNEQIQTDWLHAKVAQAKDMLQSEDLQAGTELQSQQQELVRLFKQVEQLAAYEQDVDALREQLASYSSLRAPDEVSELDAAISAEAELRAQLQQAIKALPKELAALWQQQFSHARKHWQSQSDALMQEQKQLQNAARKKARDIRRLINQGRYRVAFGVFNGLQEIFEQLAGHFQNDISREYEGLAQTLSEAKDWHQYAGEAQQEQLLEAAKVLANGDCDDANERLAQVKRLRKSWQLLGPEVAQQAKDEFEQAIEAAFAPCRDYFAEQQKLKEQAIAEREQLIAQMASLGERSGELEIRELEHQFNALLKHWRAAKQLESKLYHKLNKAFSNAQGNMGERVANFYQDNANAKAALLQQAEELQSQDDVFAATQTLKELQQQWQQIGFAGNSKERKLWQAFRRVNDSIFSQRDAAKAQQQQAHAEQKAQQVSALEALEQQLAQAQSNADLQQLRNDVQQLQLVRELQGRQKNLVARIEAALNAKEQAQQTRHLQELRASLAQGQALPTDWLNDSRLELSSEQIVLRLEIANNLASPESLSAQRMQEQVNMLDAKHHGVEYSTDELLLAWVAKAGVDEQGICQGDAQERERILVVLDKMVSV
ncbi:DUF349 domain-containing protein [Pseudoalteromonas sp. BDTF-M6]|uniref:DUF349 domain-containing protein n=1 Tax=Pseudoalteromonas sp. BDTF-M6 TaxID=2796132 RepID=UPI001BAEEB9A|nr:DUF349 domain-containing protein [Pseudoalteromonas sp. BDTF-M6]MBS3796956.1 DUF349 domain-containing protein [Pseudoalteromonas sp. BDTF-M6]